MLAKWKAFRQGQKKKRALKSQKLIKNTKAIKEDRQAAIEFFRDYEDLEFSVQALLQRFDFSLEHGINDTREKESALENIVARGEAALPIVIDHLKSSNRIAWPVKILKKLSTDVQLLELFKESLDYGEVAFDQNKVEKNFDILCYLRDYKLDGYAIKLSHFLNDTDERVRSACAEALIEQDDPKLPEILERFLFDDTPENIRIRQAVAEAFVKNKWPVKEPDKLAGRSIGSGISLGKDNILVASGG